MSSSVNRPFTEPEVADYERRRYRGLDQRLVHSRETHILKKLLRLAAAGPLRPGRLLDAPCGYGRFTGLLQQTGAGLVSSDLSPAMVKRTRARPHSAGPPLGAVADIKRGLPFQTGMFGLAFSVRFFHHLHQPQERLAVLSELARVTSRWALVSYYRLNPLHRLQRKLRRAVKPSRTRIKMVTAQEFNDEANKAGFRVVRSAPLWRGIHAQQFVLLEKRAAQK
ncbi:MAG: methyltransferase domain-containing protein [Candidatus Aminicenantales bacterium]